MKTIEDFKRESLQNMVDSLKAMPDSDYPVRISYDTEIRSKRHIYDKSVYPAICRTASLNASVIYREASNLTLREIILNGPMKVGLEEFPAGTVIPFYGNFLIESPDEIHENQFIVGIALSIREIAPKTGDPEFLDSMMKLLKTFGDDMVLTVLNASDYTKPVADDYLRYIGESHVG